VPSTFIQSTERGCAAITHHRGADTSVPVARRLEYRVNLADNVFRVMFEYRRDAYTLDLGTAGAYLRFTGDVTIEHEGAGRFFAEAGQTLWELSYFGERPGLAAPTVEQSRVVVGHQV
jgi:hypothetical protein